MSCGNPKLWISLGRQSILKLGRRWQGRNKYQILALSGDFPLNHNKTKCKMCPNNNHGKGIKAIPRQNPNLRGSQAESRQAKPIWMASSQSGGQKAPLLVTTWKLRVGLPCSKSLRKNLEAPKETPETSKAGSVAPIFHQTQQSVPFRGKLSKPNR